MKHLNLILLFLMAALTSLTAQEPKFTEYPLNTVKEKPLADVDPKRGLTAPSLRIYLPEAGKATGRMMMWFLRPMAFAMPKCSHGTPSRSPSCSTPPGGMASATMTPLPTRNNFSRSWTAGWRGSERTKKRGCLYHETSS